MIEKRFEKIVENNHENTVRLSIETKFKWHAAEKGLKTD